MANDRVDTVRMLRPPNGISTYDVTVVIPTIPGRRRMLRRALVSIGRQTAQPFGTVVVTDIERRGAHWARNLGLTQVRTTWLAWLDDDDEFLSNHLGVLMAGAAQSNADLVYSCMEVVGGRDPLAVDDGTGRWINPCGVPFGYHQERHLRNNGNFIPVTYLVKTDLVKLVGGMPPSGGIGQEEDYQLLVKLLDAGATFYHVPVVTWRYHIHGANVGGSGVGGPRGTGASNPIFRRAGGL